MDIKILTREQLQDRLAALHLASLELVQDISLQSVLERIAEIARQQVNAGYAAVGVMNENNQLEQFIQVGMPADEVQRMAHPPAGKGLIGALMNSKQTIRIMDILSDARSVGFPRQHPMMTSFLGVPILQGNRHLGQIYLTNKLNAPEFNEDDQQVIETLAAYAAISISNARLYNQLLERDKILTRRTENLGLLNDLASTLISASDIDQILHKVLNQVMDYLHIEVGEVFLLQEDGKTLNMVLHRGDAVDSIWAQEQYLIGEGVVGSSAELIQPRLLSLPTSDGRDLNHLVFRKGINQVACFPLVGRLGVLGVLSIATIQTEPLDEMELQFLSAISTWFGTAIENLRLNLQQRRLAVVEERERIGMDLHDGTIQSVYAIGLTLQHARLLMDQDNEKARKRIEQAIFDIDSTIRDLRAYILDMRPRQLYDENLMQGIERLVSEFRAHTLVEVKLKGPADGLTDLPPPQAVTLFHICQEALANIAKHARAHHVDVSLWAAADRALLEVHDDGRGFDLERIKQTIGHGLSNMQTRARSVGGDVDITSEPKSGTSVLAWVPNTNEK